MNTLHPPTTAPAASTRRRRGRAAVRLVALLPVLVLSSCATADRQDTWSPEGPTARKIETLAKPVFLIALAVGVFVYVLIGICAVKFRRKNDDDVPVQVHGNTAMEIGWTAVPAALLATIGIFSVGAIIENDKVPSNPVYVTVIGHQWWWEFHYPQPGETRLDTVLAMAPNPADVDKAAAEKREPKQLANVVTERTPVVVNANELHIPAGANMRMTVTSNDVIHSFWIPRLAGKMDAIPGRLNHLNISTDKDDAGKTFYAQCAEFCGASHADMRFKVHVDSPEDYKAWLANQAAAAVVQNGDKATDLAAKGQDIFLNSGGCVTCHYTDPSKVNDVGIIGKIGPNLTHFGSRETFAGATLTRNDQNLTRWLTDPQATKPSARMIIPQLAPDQVEALVAYLNTLK